MSLSTPFIYNWHPCSQMKDYESLPLLEIRKAHGSLLEMSDGNTLIDIISSWWCKSLGHTHPEIREALLEQSTQFEHSIFSHTTSKLSQNMGKSLCQLTKSLHKVFYACDGSSAIEIALKMALQYQYLQGNKKNKIAYLSNAYHGETLGCFSVSDLDLYQAPFHRNIFSENIYLDISSFYTYGDSNKILKNNKLDYSPLLEKLDQHKNELAAIIVEPLVQGAGGMLMYPPSLLNTLGHWTKNNDTLFIFDEIMTGLGRVGGAFAHNYLEIEPDISCVMKNLSAGWAPFGAVLCSSNIFNTFYDDYSTKKAFMHSNTYSGYSLGMATSLKALEIYKRENYFHQNKIRGKKLYEIFTHIQKETKHLANIRQLGWIVAAELVNKDGLPLEINKRTGFELYKKAILKGLLLRPLGDTIYFLPPYNISDKLLDKATDITIDAIRELFNS